MRMKLFLLRAGAFLVTPVLGGNLGRPDVPVAAEGRRLWTSPEIGTNGVVCAQFHPNGANTHPETYPKFHKQIGRVVELWEVINWRMRNPLEGEAMAADDPRMMAMQAYLAKERKGAALNPGQH